MSLWDQMSVGQRGGVLGGLVLGLVGLTVWGAVPRGGDDVVIQTDLGSVEAGVSEEVGEVEEVREISVYVSGAVRRPGVVTVRSDALVRDAVYLAGGGTDWADFDRVNLAAKMVDGQQIHVPYYPEAGVGEGDAGAVIPTVVSINLGTKEELMSLPNVGEVTAEKIIEYRTANGPFERVEDLILVPGIGEKTLDGLMGLVRL